MPDLKMAGATPKSGKPLCASCKYATTVKGQNCEELVKCSYGLFDFNHGIVAFKVSECQEYHPMNHPFLQEMKAIAWHVEARKRGPVGFEKGEEGEMEVVITEPKKRNNTYGPLGDE